MLQEYVEKRGELNQEPIAVLPKSSDASSGQGKSSSNAKNKILERMRSAMRGMVSLKKTRKDVEEVFRVFDTTGSGDIDYQARPTSSAVV